MDSRALAALLSSLTPHLLSLLLISLPTPHPNSLSLLLSHFLSSSHSAAASLSFLPRKRKQTHHHSPPPKIPRTIQIVRVDSLDLQSNSTQVPNLGEPSVEPGQPGRVNSLVPQSDTIQVPDPCGDVAELVQLGGFPRIDSFQLWFKMSSSTFEWLAGLLEPLLNCRDPADSPLNLPSETRLGIGLFRLATGAKFSEISTKFGVSEPLSRFCVKQLCRVLCNNFRFWVSFPNPDDIKSFSNFPNCCGVISTTTFELLKIDKSPKNMKNSLKAQVVVDPSCRILSMFAGFCGKRSDFEVLKRSTLYKDVEEMRVLDGPPIDIDNVAVRRYFIGDGDYPLLPWLIMPFPDPIKGSREDDFNLGLNSIRGSSIRTIASLRSWGILSKPLEGEIRDAVAYIGACSILHNGLLMREDYSALSDEVASFEGLKCGSFGESSDGSEGSIIRKALATRAYGDS